VHAGIDLTAQGENEPGIAAADIGGDDRLRRIGLGQCRHCTRHHKRQEKAEKSSAQALHVDAPSF
jgi:hypothetical protein